MNFIIGDKFKYIAEKKIEVGQVISIDTYNLPEITFWVTIKIS